MLAACGTRRAYLDGTAPATILTACQFFLSLESRHHSWHTYCKCAHSSFLGSRHHGILNCANSSFLGSKDITAYLSVPIAPFGKRLCTTTCRIVLLYYFFSEPCIMYYTYYYLLCINYVFCIHVPCSGVGTKVF